MSANNLIVNTSKTNYMLFSTCHPKIGNLKLHYNNFEITQIHNAKLLGIYMDDNLSWNYQTKQVCNNVAKKIGVLAKLNLLPIPVLRMLYHAFITSTINYGVIVWGFTTKRNIQKIFLLQERAIRLITHSHYLSECAPL